MIQVDGVCVCVCVQTITFELNDTWSRYLVTRAVQANERIRRTRRMIDCSRKLPSPTPSSGEDINKHLVNDACTQWPHCVERVRRGGNNPSHPRKVLCHYKDKLSHHWGLSPTARGAICKVVPWNLLQFALQKPRWGSNDLGYIWGAYGSNPIQPITVSALSGALISCSLRR